MFTELSPGGGFHRVSVRFLRRNGAGRNVVAAGLAELFPCLFEDEDRLEPEDPCGRGLLRRKTRTRESLFFRSRWESSIIPAAAVNPSPSYLGGGRRRQGHRRLFEPVLLHEVHNREERYTEDHEQNGMVLEFLEAADLRISSRNPGAEMSRSSVRNPQNRKNCIPRKPVENFLPVKS